ncbi:hypothetical protein RJ640_000968 [Escallonia rubra]|uniref:Phosphatidate cytidylyltransferase, mitochondrial n=1 Tax=Escallonia rubra TaxID=112253 RepID=A0AA88RDK4_9ASTE|nr:hypothetical protein RJ640_019376 [Escallonia rubra]KAK2986902.1 hypothetical protein RJ640_000968 [Escallonia rubra]
MVSKHKLEPGSLLEILPPVEFCCTYGSSLHPNNSNKSSMVDYILGVSDPLQWHSQMYKYGVVRMHNLVEDVLNWESFYLSGRLQKPVRVLVDDLDIECVNSVNLRGATSAALLLMPSKFTEEDLYAKICSLSYMGDLRMLFAEDKNKVKKIVQGQFDLFQTMYKPFLEEYATNDLLRFSSSEGHQVNLSQDCGLSAASSLVSTLPSKVRKKMGMWLGEKEKLNETGRVIREVVINSKEEAAECMRKVLRKRVMFSSARQAVAGLMTVGAVHGVRYLASKMQKAWKSRA